MGSLRVRQFPSGFWCIRKAGQKWPSGCTTHNRLIAAVGSNHDSWLWVSAVLPIKDQNSKIPDQLSGVVITIGGTGLGCFRKYEASVKVNHPSIKSFVINLRKKIVSANITIP